MHTHGSHSRSNEPSEPAAPQTQKPGWGEPKRDRSQPIAYDISHVDLFSHAPQRAPIQTKLTVGAPGDQYEQEADRIASQVVQRLRSFSDRGRSATGKAAPAQPNQTLQRETLPEEEDELQTKPLAGQIQRVELPEEDELQMQPNSLQREVELDDELQMKPLLQRQGSGAVAASDDLESAIQQSRDGGQSLSDSIRQPMEQAFGGVDFSKVNERIGEVNLADHQIQRKLEKGKLNMVGEFHGKSNERRQLEKEYCAAEVDSTQYNVEDATFKETGKLGDDATCLILRRMIVAQERLQDLQSTLQSGADYELPDKLTSETLMERLDLVLAFTEESEYADMLQSNDVKMCNENYQQILELVGTPVLTAAKSSRNITPENSDGQMDAADIYKQQSSSLAQLVSMGDNLIRQALRISRLNVDAKKDLHDIGNDIDKIRSDIMMKNGAEIAKLGGKGVWMVGEDHIRDILSKGTMDGNSITVTTREEFADGLIAWCNKNLKPYIRHTGEFGRRLRQKRRTDDAVPGVGTDRLVVEDEPKEDAEQNPDPQPYIWGSRLRSLRRYDTDDAVPGAGTDRLVVEDEPKEDAEQNPDPQPYIWGSRLRSLRRYDR